MTFIVAIQLNDSIIIAADNKRVVIKETGEMQFSSEKAAKIYTWDQGIITGTGESYVISRSIELFRQLAHLDHNKLPLCLDISRQIRELEIGTDYFQVENTKLLCSCYSERGAQLYVIQRFGPSQPYELSAIPTMDITVWLYHPNIDAISEDLHNLHRDLKDYVAFTHKADWINYYINRLAPIYQKQSQHDPLMSQSFDFFFQTKDEYLTGHIPNTQKTALDFKEISSNLGSI
ncbi:hypothetical protein HYG93_14890 [Acinetobacter sp. SwsAc6]|jgi:hypothetical protein|uniref:Uncharacterized protein n=1 Tax=Acinetobacter cumulans TaxID=2136182 RepID=A0A498CXJ6_9GAMM|nr:MULTISPECIES: hypothetical protein [Acinetobacter]NWK75529.1 hypothetical protein [Acinetobacter sp. SwsAc6]RFS24106.1 hypothetical protein DYI81_17465 [Acinetobacter sp. SWAC5]RKG44600.1 hypothetical protein D7V51_07545 [Acinetobacter cumulans]RKG51743.1 hypothetical protein D7V68_00040 [Acinetobacter cumulans]RLL34122.1 hypothetical protein D9K80_11665 [Acinetobacter cumulans]